MGALLGAPELLDTVDDILGCLLDVLGRRKIDPLLDGRVGGGGWTETWGLPPWCVISPRSTILLGPCSTNPPWSLGGGNWVSLKSVEAVSKLLWRSSKLTEGRKSNEVDVVSFTSLDAPFLPPKENREWLLDDEALSIGASAVGRRRAPILVGLAFSLRLEAMTSKQCQLHGTITILRAFQGDANNCRFARGWVSASSGAMGYGQAGQQ